MRTHLSLPFIFKSPRKKTVTWWHPSMQGLSEGRYHSQAKQYDFDPSVSFQMSELVNSNLNWNWYWKENERTKTPSSPRSSAFIHKEDVKRKVTARSLFHARSTASKQRRKPRNRAESNIAECSDASFPVQLSTPFFSLPPHATQHGMGGREGGGGERERESEHLSSKELWRSLHL